jgi:hypothetical protein
MSATLDLINEKLPELSVNELLALQEGLTAQLRHKLTTSNQSVQPEQPLLLHLIPGAYRPTLKEVEEELQELFKEDYEAIKLRDKDFDPNKLPPLPRRVIEYIDEDREDMPLPKLLQPYKPEEI